MRTIVTPQQMRVLEKNTFEQYKIDSLVVMERAALQTARVLESLYADADRTPVVLIVCGKGNNGGDGLALARILYLDGHFDVRLKALYPAENYKGDARTNAETALNLGFSLDDPWPEQAPDVLVDAIYGIGFTADRAPQGEELDAIRRINAYREKGSKVVAVDVPSGICAESGQAPGEHIIADHTVTFQWSKTGLHLYPGREACGELHIAPIGLFPEQKLLPQTRVLDESDIPALLPARPLNAHKNTFGHGLLIAGSRGMAGAAVLCATAAVNAGIGLLTVAAAQDSVLPFVQNNVPSALAFPLPEEFAPTAALLEKLPSILPSKTAVAIGCGLGKSQWARTLVHAAWELPLPLIVDADALNLLAEDPQTFGSRAAPLLLTPHPGEAARLLGRPVGDPLDDAQLLALRFHAVVLLKGATTVIATPDGDVTLNLTGNPALAAGGSGDVLTGLLLALLCQGCDAYSAAALGAYLHGKAGEVLGGKAQRLNTLDLAKNILAGL